MPATQKICVGGAKKWRCLCKNLCPEFFNLGKKHSLTEGMAAFAPIYKLLDKLPFVRNISNKIIILDKQLSGEKTENNNDKRAVFLMKFLAKTK